MLAVMKRTNPKTFLLLAGKIALSYRKIGDSERYRQEITAAAVVEVQPYVTHQIEALEDCIMLECNSIGDIQNDRVREEV